MNRKLTSMAVMGMVAGLAVSCGSASKTQGQTNNASSTAEAESTNTAVKMNETEVDGMDAAYLYLSDAQRSFVVKNNQFALNFFSKLSGKDSYVVSPLSLTYLMGMLANGANGVTREEILKTVGCDKDFSLSDLNDLCHWMVTHAGKQDPAVKVNIADYIALNNRYSLKQDFAKLIASQYNGGVESLDFSDSKTTDRINGWCKKQTDGMIPKIIDQVDAGAISYIMNAIYFNGTWKDKFRKTETKQENFKGYTRNIQRVNMMHRNGKYQYMDNADFAAVNIPYGNGTYALTVVLPQEAKSIDDIMKVMDAAKLSALRNEMEECVVDLKLPRFTTELNLDLNDIVSQLGASSMFDASRSDFSYFCNEKAYVSKMIQKAKIEVSEEGTKAAAVTAAVMMMTSLEAHVPRRVDFHADRPFVYMITERTTGAIFFIGQFVGEE